MPDACVSRYETAAEIVLHVVPLPALADNYIWLLHDDNGNAVVVDPGEAAPVHAALDDKRLRLRAILLTHHHPDHIAGADELCSAYHVPVYAPADERIAIATHRVGDGDDVELNEPPCRFHVISVPGHTRSHIVYVGENLLLCGDTLFSLGCGRMFEGNASQMLSSLQRLAKLPADTLVCCGHEYTAANARFAVTVDPNNTLLQKRLLDVDALRSAQQPSVPIALSSELACNPFLRVGSEAVITWCRANGHPHQDSVARFASLRTAKDVFRA